MKEAREAVAMKRWMPALLFWLSATLTLAGWSGKVVGVADGDTITVLRVVEEKKATLKVRLEGIDAPEMRQPGGTAAKTALSDRVFEKVVRVEEMGRDRWGRIIARVWLGRREINLEMVRAGHAWHFTRYSKREVLATAEREARAARRGLWGKDKPTPVPPWEWRGRKR